MHKILIVDSDDKSAAAMSRVLSVNDFDVITVTAPVAFLVLKKTPQNAPDLIILSDTAGGESGFDVCRKLRKSMTNERYIPILMTTVESLGTGGMFTKATKAGADDIMAKSSNATFLLSKVNSLLRIKALSDQLSAQYDYVRKANHLLNEQLKMARQVQRALITEEAFIVNDMCIVSRYEPALAIGGDFYDISTENEGVVSVFIGDVSGHGISAALLTAMLNMMIKNVSQKYANPAQILFHMNNAFCDIFENTSTDIAIYACMLYALIDTNRRRIYFANAGLPQPLFVEAKTEQCYELSATGTPLGMIRNQDYEQNIKPYEEKDMLLFYTDGLSDNVYKRSSEEFYDRIKLLLLDTYNSVKPEEIVKSMIETFNGIGGDETMKYDMDDISLILCKM